MLTVVEQFYSLLVMLFIVDFVNIVNIVTTIANIVITIANIVIITFPLLLLLLLLLSLTLYCIVQIDFLLNYNRT